MNNLKETGIESVSVNIQDIDWSDLTQIYLLRFTYQLIGVFLFGIVFFAILSWVLLADGMRELFYLQNTELSLKHQYSDKVALMQNIPQLVADIEHIRQGSSDLIGRVPSQFDVADIIRKFYAQGVANGIKITANRLMKNQKSESFIIHRFVIETTGSYHQLQRFCFDLGLLNELVVLNDVSLTMAKNSSKELLQFKATANIYQLMQDK